MRNGSTHASHAAAHHADPRTRRGQQVRLEVTAVTGGGDERDMFVARRSRRDP